MTIIMLPTWGIDGLVFNTATDDVEWIVHNDEGWDAPPEMRDTETPRVIGAGSYDSTSYPGSRLIILDGILRGSSRTIVEQQLRKFAKVGGSGETTPLVVTGYDLELQAAVKRAGKTSIKRIGPTDVAWQLSLWAPDPRKYSTTLRTASTGLGTPPTDGVRWGGPAGATGTEWGGPAGTTGTVWQADAGTPGIVLVTNDGTEAAPIMFVITDTAEDISNPAVTNLETAEVIAYNGVVPANSTLEIDADPEAGAVLLDGSDRGTSLSRADFFTVPPESTIRVQFSASAPAAGASLLVRSRDTYI